MNNSKGRKHLRLKKVRPKRRDLYDKLASVNERLAKIPDPELRWLTEGEEALMDEVASFLVFSQGLALSPSELGPVLLFQWRTNPRFRLLQNWEDKFKGKEYSIAFVKKFNKLYWQVRGSVPLRNRESESSDA